MLYYKVNFKIIYSKNYDLQEISQKVIAIISIVPIHSSNSWYIKYRTDSKHWTNNIKIMKRFNFLYVGYSPFPNTKKNIPSKIGLILSSGFFYKNHIHKDLLLKYEPLLQKI